MALISPANVSTASSFRRRAIVRRVRSSSGTLGDGKDPFAVRVRRWLTQPSTAQGTSRLPHSRSAHRVRPGSTRRSRRACSSVTSPRSTRRTSVIARSARVRPVAAQRLRRLQVQRIGDQRHLLGHAEQQRPARPHTDADVGMTTLSSSSSGWIILSSRRAPNQSSTLGSSDPLATTSIAHPSSVAAAPTPTNSRVTDRAQQEERAGQDDQCDADGEQEQRPATSAAVGVPHTRPRDQTSARADIEQRQQPRQRRPRRPQVAGAGTPPAPSPAAAAR